MTIHRHKDATGAWRTDSERKVVTMPYFETQEEALASLEDGQFTLYVAHDGAVKLLAKNGQGTNYGITFRTL